MTILIVEDEEAIASIWKRFLSPLSDDIRVAGDLPTAFELMRKLPPPDLVLLDLRLPGSESAEATLANITKLKEINPGAVVMVLTGATEANLPILAAQLGADGFQAKASVVGQERLFRAIQSILEPRVSDSTMPAYARALALYEKLTALLPPCTIPAL